MKKILSAAFAVIFFYIPVLLYASGKDSTLVQAGNYYQEGKYSQAIELYQALADSGWSSPALFYNLGNSYFKNHDIKSAILYYERAKRLDPGDEAIDFNLQLSRTLIFDKVEEVPELFLITWAKALRDMFSVRTWAWISIWSFIVILIFGLVFLFVRSIRVKRFSFGLGILFIVLCVTSLTFGYLQKVNINRTDQAIVFVPSVTIKSSPDESGNNLFVLHEGIKVYIEDRIGEWCEIRIADGNKGWIRMKDLRVI